MNCRGHTTRVDIVCNYKVTPIAHIQLLNGQTKYSDAGQIIENDYYIFKLANKIIESDVQTITCGIKTANDFLRLISHKGLPIFNPLVSISNEQKIHNGNVITNNSKKNNETAIQLYNAIMWIIILIDAKAYTTIYKIKDDVEKYMNYEPYLSKIKSVNTIINNCFKEKTLSNKINELRETNNIRNSICDFSLLQEKLKNENIQSNF